MSTQTRPRPAWHPASEAALEGHKRPERWVFPLERWHQGPPVEWHVADAALAVSLLAASVTLANLDSMPNGLEAFLAVRVTVKNVLLLTAFGLLWPGVMMACGLYFPSRLRTGHGEWPRLLVAGAIGCALGMVFPLSSRSGAASPWQMVLFGVAIVPAAALLRASVRAMDPRNQQARQRHVVLVGSGPLAGRLYHQLLSDPSQNIRILGYVDSEPRAPLAGNGAGHLGGVQELDQILMHRVVDHVFIGLPVKSRYDEIQQSLAACARVGVPASYSTDLFGGPSAHPDSAAHGAPMLSLSAAPSAGLMAIKRAMDVAGALVLLLVLAPLMLGVAVGIKLTSPGPVLFAQDRYGYMKRLFRMYKFRTMVVGAEEIQEQLEDRNEASGPVFKIRDDPRITPFGRFLRRTSLDELPQICHVLTGEMSLVGPRPLPVRDVTRFPEPWLMRRFSMRPGLTCLWQISGRSRLKFDQWIALDLQYIDTWSLWLDLKILLWTGPAVLRGDGAH